eukprot:8478850-Pyramimonas_sp.AAC.1
MNKRSKRVRPSAYVYFDTSICADAALSLCEKSASGSKSDGPFLLLLVILAFEAAANVSGRAQGRSQVETGRAHPVSWEIRLDRLNNTCACTGFERPLNASHASSLRAP